MALTASLLPGFKYEITGGQYEGEVVTIVSNVPFPDCAEVPTGAGAKNKVNPHKDGLPHNCTDPQGIARKITVSNDMGDEFYILPRLLSDQPVSMVGIAPAMAPVVASAPVVQPSLAQSAVVNLTNPIIATTPLEIQQVIAPTPAGQPVTPINDPMDSRLDHLRPHRRVLKRYERRVMSNGMDDVEFFLQFTNDEYRIENDGYPGNVMLKGDTQSGKTMLCEVLACEWSDRMAAQQKERGEAVTYTKPMPIFTLSGSSGVTDYDLFGQPTMFTHPETGVQSMVWLYGVADLAAQCGGIFMLDEINAMKGDVTTSLHSLADFRHSYTNRNKAVMKGGIIMPEVVKAHFDLWLIGTYNEGYRGMAEMNEAFVNRFRHIPWGYDKDVEARLIHSAAIRLLGDCLRTSRSKNSLRTPIGTAALMRCERDVTEFGPVLGLEIMSGMFKPNEREIVNSIIEDRSIIVLLNEEQRQKKIEDQNRGVVTP